LKPKSSLIINTCTTRKSRYPHKDLGGREEERDTNISKTKNKNKKRSPNLF
jgi:hypothetical protein